MCHLLRTMKLILWVSSDTRIRTQGIQILSTTDADIDSLFTHQFELNDTKEAMELTRTSKGDA